MRFHLNPSYTDNLISHDRQNFADANSDSYSLEVLLQQWAQVIHCMEFLNPYLFYQETQQLLLNLFNNTLNTTAESVIPSLTFLRNITQSPEGHIRNPTTGTKHRLFDFQSCAFNRKSIFPLLNLQPAEDKNCHSKSPKLCICCQAAVRATREEGQGGQVCKCVCVCVCEPAHRLPPLHQRLQMCLLLSPRSLRPDSS